MNDQELDKLIMQAVERKATTDAIEQTVMKQLRQECRRHTVRRVARMVAFAFGLPLLMIFMGYSVYHVLLQHSPSTWVIVGVAIYTLTTLTCFAQVVKDFKI